ncbi:hypothetical protein [Myxococcus sp. SDU36]|uniref:hypothetical protein n=1 Tax=Myxococcus sp. SDU36 TaxID=2831967 RepID=UPI00254296C2|nr:hypothetical protein [Myxococcus sp. SDU36]WIG94089.1 hypothetical protein KGD87_26540 [Myxococcus sp. SDU36]
MEDSFYLSHTTPTKDHTELKVWWGLNMDSSYNPFKVEFLHRDSVLTGSLPKDCLTFKLVHEPSGPPLEVDLKDGTIHVWPYLPSTVPTASEIEAAHRQGERIFGFLFLSDIWVSSENQRPDGKYGYGPHRIDLLSKMESGGKWPLAGFTPSITKDEAL